MLEERPQAKAEVQLYGNSYQSRHPNRQSRRVRAKLLFRKSSFARKVYLLR